MPVGDRKDPYRSYGFLVEIDGITRAGFRECSGLIESRATRPTAAIAHPGGRHPG